MTLPSLSDIEQTLLSFRSGRRVVIEKLLPEIVGLAEIEKPVLLLSRVFARIKSADSILEKMRRKGINIQSLDELPQKIPDVLGMRVIVETGSELSAVDDLLEKMFKVVERTDQRESPNEFGARGLEYGLQYMIGGATYFFELQARTFLQHYWATRSFHLFHKKSRDVALQHRDDLGALSEALHRADSVGNKLRERYPSHSARSPVGVLEPFCSWVHLVVVEAGERFVTHVAHRLSGNDSTDHIGIVAKKLELYSTYPNCAIVECSCLNLLSFMLNEPHVHVSLDHFDALAK